MPPLYNFRVLLLYWWRNGNPNDFPDALSAISLGEILPLLISVVSTAAGCRLLIFRLSQCRRARMKSPRLVWRGVLFQAAHCIAFVNWFTTQPTSSCDFVDMFVCVKFYFKSVSISSFAEEYWLLFVCIVWEYSVIKLSVWFEIKSDVDLILHRLTIMTSIIQISKNIYNDVLKSHMCLKL